MKRIFLLTTILLISIKSWSVHLVGGEIQVKFLGSNNYEIKFLCYYDFSGTLVPPPASIPLSIYERGNVSNAISNLTLPITSDSVSINYNCGTTIYDFGIASYTDTVVLSPAIYNSPSGYILVADKGPGPNSQNFTGDVVNIYTLIPPVTNTIQIINSSPIAKPFTTEIICMNEDIQIDQKAIDPDGDSLAYGFFTPASLGAPNAGLIEPVSSPYTYPPTQFNTVTWNSGFNVNAQITGSTANEDLKIDPESGLMSLSADVAPGIYTIGQFVHEFRDINNDGSKELIGGVYRTIAYNVLPCPWYSNSKPNTFISNVLDTMPYPCNLNLPPYGDTINVCTYGIDNFIEIASVDSDSSAIYSYSISTTLITDPSNDVTIQDTVIVKNPGQDTIRNIIKVRPSSPNFNKHYEINVIVEDNDICGKSETDTLHFWVFVGIPEGLENSLQQTVNIYPNPNSGTFYLKTNIDLIGKKAFLYNTQLKLIESRVIRNDTEIFDFQQNGLYILRFQGSDTHHKIIIN